jgi:hypothetical protein
MMQCIRKKDWNSVKKNRYGLFLIVYDGISSPFYVQQLGSNIYHFKRDNHVISEVIWKKCE